MAWHTTKARMSTMPILGTVDLTVAVITSEHGEVELMPPVVFPNRKSALKLAKRLAKPRRKGGPMIDPDSEVVSVIQKTRKYRDSWPPPPPRSLE